jgi:hypothetical protein
MVRMGSGTNGIELPMVRLASVSGVIGSPMPSPKSAKSVSYRSQAYSVLKVIFRVCIKGLSLLMYSCPEFIV